MKHYLFFLLGVVLLVGAAGVATSTLSQSESAPLDYKEPPLVVSSTLEQQTDMVLLEVDKATLTATLKTWPENPKDSKVLKSFKIAIGKSQGDKQFEGDNKTPEGVYYTQKHIPGSTLPAKYGTIAIPIDFPNAIDRVQRKTGYGIWLHGVDREARIEEANVTEGCVAFHNQDVLKLSAWLKPHQGVVVIAEDGKVINRPEDLKDVRELTEEWIAAWDNRDIDAYIKNYHPDFRYNHHNLKSYKSYKGRVFNSYSKMVVNLSDLRVVTHEKYAVTMFNQDFHGDDRFSSIGRKRLYWIKNEQGKWQIMSEIFENRRFEFMTFSDKELAALSDATINSTNLTKEKEIKASSL